MSTSEIDNVTDQLSKTSVDVQNELSFAGRGMKLDKSEDAAEIVKGIEACSHMTALRLEGNTLGVDAASTIADALKKHPEFERALWKDMFTGRLKTEIPPALVSLGNAIMEAGAKLVELDLSDNAFGPIGVEGIAELLKSPSCYSLKELKLNNNGLGPRGGKLLAKTLMESYEKSVAAGTPLGLKVFVSGRGRLENEGSTALAEAFKAMGTLEEVSMPQNGINHAGITALADAFASNKNLKNINLNDNTFTEKGALSMAKALPHMQQLEVLNFGDCLVRTKGAAAIATSIKQTHKHLKEVNLGFNEIKKSGATAIAEALEGKPIETLDLDGNQFGEEGCELLRATLEAVDMLEALGSLSDDEGSEDEDEAGDDAEEDSDNEDNQDDEEGEIVEDPALQVQGKAISPSQQKQEVSVAEFLQFPSASKLTSLGPEKRQEISEYLGEGCKDADKCVELVMRISSVVDADNNKCRQVANECADDILSKLMNNGSSSVGIEVTNSILVHIGLLKSENKVKPVSKPTGPLLVLEHVVKQAYFPKSGRDILTLFLSRPNKTLDSSCTDAKHKLLQALYQF